MILIKKIKNLKLKNIKKNQNKKKEFNNLENKKNLSMTLPKNIIKNLLMKKLDKEKNYIRLKLKNL